ncbi:MAG: 3-hydroxyacyl-ACP dehydratase FabZ [Clostridiales Family XIII bacterium]|jgi:3-hydroxyacyl-[acyl-carrier-protein] dehydratase|nr:3-hydroxyacyl-ACP dehydratase FabZ [Clostridiales Family XIII bacterium]
MGHKLNQEEIKKIIPHRDPMLLIDAVTDIEPGHRIEATFFVSPERDLFRGHFPEAPVLPGVYTVECMAQASDILLLSFDRYKGTIPYFIGINNVKFMNKIEPGDTIEIHSEIASERIEKAIVTCSATVYNHGEIAATGEVTLAMR